MIAGAQRVGLGIQEGQDALTLVVVDDVPGAPCRAAEQADRDQNDAKLHAGEQHDDEAGCADQQRRPEVRLHHDHGGGNHDQDSHDDQVEERRWERALVHVPGAHHGHRELHDLGGLKSNEPDVEPALRTLADMAGHRHHGQEQYSDDVGDGREQAQILRTRQPREREQGGHRDGDVGQVVLDHFDVLTRGAVDDQDADADDQRQHAGQRTVQTESPQRTAAGRQRAACPRRGEFIEYHDAASGIAWLDLNQRSFSRPSAPARNGQITAPTTGANHRLKLVTGLPVAPSIQNRMNW